MADEIVNPIPAPVASPEATPSSAPAPVETPTVTPESAPISAPAETVVDAPVEPTKPAEPPVEPTPEAAKKAETLLAGEKKAEEKPTEVKTEENPAEEAKPVEVVIPAYEPFTLPENVQMDAEKMGDFTKFLGEFETTVKAPHEEMQKLGQQMVDRHIAEMQRYTESLQQAWTKQKNDWKESFLKDPEFANRTDTAVNAAIDTISVYGGSTVQQQEFRDLMESSGVGNHPAMIRLLSNVIMAKIEPKPLAAPMIAPKAAQSKVEKMYGSKRK